MKARTKHRRLLAAFAVFGVLAGAACSYDFHAFDPIEGGFDASLDQANNNDTGPGSEDAGQDVDANLPTCTAKPPPKCLTEAGACGSNCSSTKERCRQNCPLLNPRPCQAECDNAEVSCKLGCRSTCENCTKDAGCEMGDIRRCDDAVNGRDAGPDA
ncbi:hypothetical protein LVJ94_16350 [Pendulispora rubella]|uniref:Uncharacterized protein n=1 Tax=Pendulispora rubella TaxID=2741070 RepID=A0ABZ2LCZ0_9BACT